MTRARERGFTLLEVLAVVAIMTVLMGIVIYGLGAFQKEGQREGTKAVILKLRTAIDAYRAEYGQYPPDGNCTRCQSHPEVKIPGISGPLKGSRALIYFLGSENIRQVEVGQDVRVQKLAPFLEITGDMVTEPEVFADVAAEADQSPNLNFITALLSRSAKLEIGDKFGSGELARPIHYDNCEPDEDGAVHVNDLTDQHRSLQDGAMVQAPDPRRTGSGRSGTVKTKNNGAYDVWSHGLDLADTADDVTNWR